jgi:diguanylate cyclase (GGDEF)-like protein
VAVLFCDLNSSKAVNDTLGHAAGDELLARVASRLVAAARAGDVVSRLSGDEFAIVLPALASQDDAQAVAALVVAVLDEEFTLAAGPVRVGASVGVALHSAVGGDANLLLRAADAAMYRAKLTGCGVAFAPEASPEPAGLA